MTNNEVERTKEEYGVDWAETGLWYYHKKSVKMLLELNIIKYVDEPDGLSFTCELTPWFIQQCTEYLKAKNGEKFFWEDLFVDIAKAHKKKLGKKLMYDMIALMLFIDKFGKNGEIWIQKHGIHGGIIPQKPIHINLD